MIRKGEKRFGAGTGRDGRDLSSDPGVLDANPGEPIAATHAGCFTMALAFGLQDVDHTPTELITEVARDDWTRRQRLPQHSIGSEAPRPTADSPDEATFTRLTGNQVTFLPDSTIDPGPVAGAYSRKFALSKNSKGLHAGSNSSEKILIIGGTIIAAMDRSSRSREIAETASKLPG